LREKRGVRRCAQIVKWRPLFIGARGCCGAVRKSTMARLLRRARGLGSDAALFYGS
jgi:hypothetical protein